MEWLTSLLDVGASVSSGGLFGLIGAIGTNFLKAREAQKAHERKMELMKFNLDVVQSGHANTMEELKQQASTSGLIASIEADKIQGISVWAANIKALYRPFLTTILVVIVTYIFSMLLDAMRGQENMIGELFKPDEVLGLLKYTVMSVVFAAVTSVVWWFGDRALSPPSSK